MPYKLIEHCYVLPQTTKIHQIAYDRDLFIWYPERGMSLIDQMSYIPYKQSIVTECPWVVGCYGREQVFVWDGSMREWKNPNQETYGADITVILGIMGFHSLIPARILDGGKSLYDKMSAIELGY